MRTRASFIDRRRHSRGQALVETALLLPLLLILLLGAIDFGRAFFGWVNLHQAARIGANFASINPETGTDTDAQDDLVTLIEGDIPGLNCDPDIDESGTFAFDDLDLTYSTVGVGLPGLGDYATLAVKCRFTLLTPLATVLFDGPIEMRATSTFPVRAGCINCPSPVPATPPPTPEQCRLLPVMEDLSVAGARLAWASAGFISANFDDGGAEPTQTVKSAFVTQNDPLGNCLTPYAIFSSTVLIDPVDPDPDTDPGCATVPNLRGVPLSDARDAWDVEFDIANFTADTTDDLRIVIQQTTSPTTSTPGVTCLELTASIDVLTGDPLPDPPPPPCEVPAMIEDSRSVGEAEWIAAGFSAANFSPSTGNFTIRSQSLVGGAGQWQPCSASITVAANP